MLQRLGISVGPGFRDWLEPIKDIMIQHITAETELMAEKCSESSELILILSWILIITSRPHILIIMHSSLQWFSSKRLHMESDTAGYVVMREWSMICYHPELIFLKQHTLKCFIPLKPKPQSVNSSGAWWKTDFYKVLTMENPSIDMLNETSYSKQSQWFVS